MTNKKIYELMRTLNNIFRPKMIRILMSTKFVVRTEFIFIMIYIRSAYAKSFSNSKGSKYNLLGFSLTSPGSIIPCSITLLEFGIAVGINAFT